MTNEEIVAKLLGTKLSGSEETSQPPETKNGIFRMMSPKGKGGWLARYKDQEKVFYDGSYGTSVSAKNYARKWYDIVSLGPQKVKEREQVERLLAWLEKETERFGKENVEEIKYKVIEIFYE